MIPVFPSIRMLLIGLLGISSILQGCVSDQDPTQLDQGTLFFNDPFTTINTDYWAISQQSLDSGSGSVGTSTTRLLTTHVIADNDSCFIYNNGNIVSQKLRLSAANQTFNCPNTNNSLSYSGGELRSVSTFTNGRFTVKLQTFLETGALTSFYLYKRSEEIGFHIPGDDPSKVYLSFQKDNVSSITTLTASQLGIGGFDASEQIYTYEILWSENLIQWSINEQVILSEKKDVPNSSMRFIVSTWVSGDSSQAGTPASSLSAHTDFDSIRIETFP